MNAAAPFSDVLGQDPQSTAIVEPGNRSFSASQVLDASLAVAHRLQKMGLVPGDRLVLQLPNGFLFSAAALGALLAGGVPVLIEPGLGDDVYRAMVSASGARWGLVHPKLLAVGWIPGLRNRLGAKDLPVPPAVEEPLVEHRLLLTQAALFRWAGTGHQGFKPVARTSEDDGVLVFTGGTTANPKGVRLSHGALAHYLANIEQVVRELDVGRFLADTPQQVLYALRLGMTAYVTRGARRKRAASIWELVSRGEVDTYFGSPYVWTHIMGSHPQEGRKIGAGFRNILLGGAPVTREFLARLYDWLPGHVKVKVLYGLTEAGPVCAMDGRDKLGYAGSGDLVGVPLPGVRIAVEGGGSVGEVVVRSTALYSGYLGEAPRLPQAGLRTGDVGSLVQVGGTEMLALLGRQKEMIIRKGVNIYPLSVEESLRTITDAHGSRPVRLAVLVGRWNSARQDEDVVLCVELSGKGEGSPDWLRRQAATICGPDVAPDEVVVVPEIPVTGRQNKIDRKALRVLVARAEAAALPLPRLKVPFAWRAFARKQGALWLDLKKPGAALRQGALHLGLLGANQAGWLADRVVADGWEDTPITGPLFILGHQRSGTTFMHRLLSLDEEHARALKFHEMLLPSTFWQRRLGRLVSLDRRMGSGLAVWFHLWQRETFGRLDGIHRLRFDEIEEDEFVLWTAFQSAMCVNDSPLASVSSRLDELRQFESWPQKRQLEALAWYKACLLKKVHRSPPSDDDLPPWPVSKNPAFSQKIPLLQQVFPDARFIYLMRNPLETIPSRLSLIEAIWQARFPGFEKMTPEQARVILADSLATYLKADAGLATLPDERKLVVQYTDFIAEPKGTVESIYRHFSLPGPGARLRDKLAAVQQQQRSHRSSHVYDLASFGLSPAEITCPLQGLMEGTGL
jgi:acyl-CoA synthetase (AMP-forming)/AMP-acid ligase II